MQALRGKCVVVTRAENDAEALCRRLQVLGADVRVVPSIRVDRLPQTADMRRAVDRLPTLGWVAFASRHGVHALADLLDELVPDVGVTGRILTILRSCRVVKTIHGVSMNTQHLRNGIEYRFINRHVQYRSPISHVD